MILPLICAMALFASCRDVIFYKIKNEVKLEDANIQGEIHKIVRFSNGGGDYIYVDNGQIRYKPAESTDNDDWSKHMAGLRKLEFDYYGNKFKGVQIIKVAADSSNMYALGMEWEVDDDEGENMPKRWVLFTSTGPGTQWTEIWSLRRGDYGELKQKYLRLYGVAALFCTNTYDAGNRKAYLRVTLPAGNVPGETKFYELSGTSSDFSTELASSSYTYIHDGESPRVNGRTHDAAYFNSKVYFLNDNSDDAGIGTDEKPGTAASHIYYSDGNTLYYSANGSDWTAAAPGTSGRIISMALTSNFFILGTGSGGLFRVMNVDGVPTGRTIDFSTNADVALGSPYMIRSLYCIDPSKSELEAIIYATADFTGSRGSSTGSMDDVGLWSYYPARGNWNRE